MLPRESDHKSRYEIFSRAMDDLGRAEALLLAIDLTTCPPSLRPHHVEAREAIKVAITQCAKVCDGELDTLDGR